MEGLGAAGRQVGGRSSGMSKDPIESVWIDEL